MNWGNLNDSFCPLVANLSSQKQLTSSAFNLCLALAGGLCLGCGFSAIALKGIATVLWESIILLARQPVISSESHNLVYASNPDILEQHPIPPQSPTPQLRASNTPSHSLRSVVLSYLHMMPASQSNIFCSHLHDNTNHP